MIAIDTAGRRWEVRPGFLAPIGHTTDPDTLTRAEEDVLFDQLPQEQAEQIADPAEVLYDQMWDVEKDRRIGL